MRGADALAASLAAHAARRVFTLSGNHVMPVFDAALTAGIELIHVRHEGAAVHMADAWARLTGEVGVALVTGGPGHANAVGALYTALMAESPVVLLSGHAPVSELGMGAFQEMRQAEMAGPVTKASWVCTKAEEVAADFAKAVRIAQRGRPGPVHLSLPSDVLDATAGAHAPLDSSSTPAVTNDVAPLIERLSEAKRPLVLCGPVCTTRPGRLRMVALQAASGFPVVAMESPRGVADPGLGAFAQMLARADCVLLAGKRLDFTLKFGKAFAAGCEVLQIDDDANALEALEALTYAAKPPRSTKWRDEVKAAIAYRPPGWNELSPVRVLGPLQAILDEHPDSVFISDGGEFGSGRRRAFVRRTA